MAAGWVYVSDRTLNNSVEKWLTPHEFLTETPWYPTNPLKGKAVSDCEEHANTLVSLLRASGVSAEDVRVVLGRDASSRQNRGHVWVELFINGKWLDLDASSGSYWSDETERLVNQPALPFDYYQSHSFPPLIVEAYYNDVYYYEPGGPSTNAPDLWLYGGTPR